MASFASHLPRSSPTPRPVFARAHTSIGFAGHWVKTAGILTPLVIHEVIKDPEQKWRAIRISSVITALLAEALWTARIYKERQQTTSEHLSTR